MLSAPPVTLRALVALVASLALAPASTAGAGAPAFLCAPAKARSLGSAPRNLSLTDRLETPRDVVVGAVRSACWAEAPAPERLTGLAARGGSRKARRVGTEASLVTRFGTERVMVKAFAGVAVGSTGDAPSGAPRTCYTVRGGRPSGGRTRVVVTDAAGERAFDVGRPTRLCLPTVGDDDAPELLCHAARLARTKPLAQGRARPFRMTLATTLGTVDLRVGAPRELCVPVLAPASVPEPTFTLAVTPSVLTVLAGERPALEVTARFADGHEEAFGYRVRFTSSDETVIAGTSVAGAFVEAVGL